MSPATHDRPLEFIPAMRPMLPSSAKLLPYLHRIDSSRIYSNNGPLATELERRLAAYFDLLPGGGVVSAASGTAALIGAILTTVGAATAQRPLALIPAYTFVATASAVERCGYRPYLVDIDSKSWMIEPDRLRNLPICNQVGLVVPV